MTRSCPICGSRDSREVCFDSLVIPTVSSNPKLHRYTNYLCEPCGLVFLSPRMNAEDLHRYYNSDYRLTDYALQLRDKKFDLPVAIPRSGVSFLRFQTFYDMVAQLADSRPGIVPTSDDWMLDLGAYQGMFLYAARNAWNCRTIATDYNAAGINFAKTALGIDEAFETRDIYSDQIGRKVKFAVLIHAFEHLDDPIRFLERLKRDLLRDDGYVYVEIPNLRASPLSDPTHCFMYSPDGLRRIMARSGFETIALRVHGAPSTHTAVWENDRMNISAILAPSSNATGGTDVAARGPALTYRTLKADHRKIARSIVASQLKQSALAALRLCYYVAFVLGVETFSGRAARRIKDYLSQLHRSASKQS